MELRHLRYFVAAAELEHFGRAANKCSIVQPALSKQIAQLEGEVGTALFVRQARGVRLTPAGRRFLTEAREVLRRSEDASRLAREVAQGRLGRLKLGFVESVGYRPDFPRAVQEFRRFYPDIRLEIKQLTSANQAEAIRQGELDLGFMFHRNENAPTLPAIEIAREDIMLAVPLRHRLARCVRVKVEQLRDEQFVWIARAVSPPFFDRVVTAFNAAGVPLRVVQEAGSDIANFGLVAVHAGLSFCTTSAKHWKPKGVALRPIVGLERTLRLSLAWSEENPNPAIPHFVEVARRSFKSN